MPVYEYTHAGEAPACPLGREFEATQSIKDDAFKVCPRCGGAVRRLISRPFISIPQSDSNLKNMGFTKLVKRDTGVYENVTALDGESRYMVADKPETMPNLKKRISD
jgi:putative FmdB family regulatory protein